MVLKFKHSADMKEVSRLVAGRYTGRQTGRQTGRLIGSEAEKTDKLVTW